MKNYKWFGVVIVDKWNKEVELGEIVPDGVVPVNWLGDQPRKK
jgi:hypothetical protein